MKTPLLLFATLFIASCSPKAKQEVYTAMTYNIRYDNPEDGENNWHKRKEDFVRQIQKHSPDILGTQEGLTHQIAYLDSTLSNYSYVGVGREDGKTQGEYTAIFYDTTEFNCLDSKTFWLSESPDIISIGWDAALERICTYALLENKRTKQRIWVLNAHFDHRGTVARNNSASLILAKIKKLQEQEKHPVLLMGDFNATPNDTPIQILKNSLTDSYEGAQKRTSKTKGTFNDFDTTSTAKYRIDYIFTEGVQLESFEILKETRKNGRFISDHFPVTIDFSVER